jgi:hypothetical protein
MTLQGGFAVEALLAGIPGDLGAVDGDPLPGDESLGAQRRDMADEQIVEALVMVRVEIGERVLVGQVVATQPLQGEIRGAAAVQVAGAADAAEAGVQPQGEEHVRAEGRLAGVAFDRFDAGMEGGEVELLDHVPDGTHRVVLGQLLLERGVRAVIAVQWPVTRRRLREYHQQSS